MMATSGWRVLEGWKGWLLAAALLVALQSALAQGEGPDGFDIYGTERFDRATLRQELRDELRKLVAAIAARDEQRVAAAKDAIVARLEPQGPFAYLEVETIRYFPPNAGIYVTIDVVEEADAAKRMPFRRAEEFHQAFDDPDGLIAAWREYEAIVLRLAAAGAFASSTNNACPALHCIASFEHPELARYVKRFDSGATRYAETLYRMVERDQDPEHRAAAVYLLAHASDAERLLPVLGQAMYDPDAGVRNAAMRVLLQMATQHSELDYPIDSLIDAMDFPAVTDRNKAAIAVQVLASLQKYRDVIRSRAIDTCLRLLRLEQPNNRIPAHQILKSVSGLDYGLDAHASWERWVASQSPGRNRGSLPIRPGG